MEENASYKIIGEATQSLTFSKPDEKMVYFNLVVADFKSIGKAIVEDSGNGESASFIILADVVNPNSMKTMIQDVV